MGHFDASNLSSNYQFPRRKFKAGTWMFPEVNNARQEIFGPSNLRQKIKMTVLKKTQNKKIYFEDENQFSHGHDTQNQTISKEPLEKQATSIKFAEINTSRIETAELETSTKADIGDCSKATKFDSIGLPKSTTRTSSSFEENRINLNFTENENVKKESEKLERKNPTKLKTTEEIDPITTEYDLDDLLKENQKVISTNELATSDCRELATSELNKVQLNARDTNLIELNDARCSEKSAALPREAFDSKNYSKYKVINNIDEPKKTTVSSRHKKNKGSEFLVDTNDNSLREYASNKANVKPGVVLKQTESNIKITINSNEFQNSISDTELMTTEKPQRCNDRKKAVSPTNDTSAIISSSEKSARHSGYTRECALKNEETAFSEVKSHKSITVNTPSEENFDCKTKQTEKCFNKSNVRKQRNNSKVNVLDEQSKNENAVKEPQSHSENLNNSHKVLKGNNTDSRNVKAESLNQNMYLKEEQPKEIFPKAEMLCINSNKNDVQNKKQRNLERVKRPTYFSTLEDWTFVTNSRKNNNVKGQTKKTRMNNKAHSDIQMEPKQLKETKEIRHLKASKNSVKDKRNQEVLTSCKNSSQEKSFRDFVNIEDFPPLPPSAEDSTVNLQSKENNLLRERKLEDCADEKENLRIKPMKSDDIVENLREKLNDQTAIVTSSKKSISQTKHLALKEETSHKINSKETRIKNFSDNTLYANKNSTKCQFLNGSNLPKISQETQTLQPSDRVMASGSQNHKRKLLDCNENDKIKTQRSESEKEWKQKTSTKPENSFTSSTEEERSKINTNKVKQSIKSNYPGSAESINETVNPKQLYIEYMKKTNDILRSGNRTVSYNGSVDEININAQRNITKCNNVSFSKYEHISEPQSTTLKEVPESSTSISIACSTASIEGSLKTTTLHSSDVSVQTDLNGMCNCHENTMKQELINAKDHLAVKENYIIEQQLPIYPEQGKSSKIYVQKNKKTDVEYQGTDPVSESNPKNKLWNRDQSRHSRNNSLNYQQNVTFSGKYQKYKRTRKISESGEINSESKDYVNAEEENIKRYTPDRSQRKIRNLDTNQVNFRDVSQSNSTIKEANKEEIYQQNGRDACINEEGQNITMQQPNEHVHTDSVNVDETQNTASYQNTNTPIYLIPCLQILANSIHLQTADFYRTIPPPNIENSLPDPRNDQFMREQQTHGSILHLQEINPGMYMQNVDGTPLEEDGNSVSQNNYIQTEQRNNYLSEQENIPTHNTCPQFAVSESYEPQFTVTPENSAYENTNVESMGLPKFHQYQCYHSTPGVQQHPQFLAVQFKPHGSTYFYPSGIQYQPVNYVDSLQQAAYNSYFPNFAPALYSQNSPIMYGQGTFDFSSQSNPYGYDTNTHSLETEHHIEIGEEIVQMNEPR